MYMRIYVYRHKYIYIYIYKYMYKYQYGYVNMYMYINRVLPAVQHAGVAEVGEAAGGELAPSPRNLRQGHQTRLPAFLSKPQNPEPGSNLNLYF